MVEYWWWGWMKSWNTEGLGRLVSTLFAWVSMTSKKRSHPNIQSRSPRIGLISITRFARNRALARLPKSCAFAVQWLVQQSWTRTWCLISLEPRLIQFSSVELHWRGLNFAGLVIELILERQKNHVTYIIFNWSLLLFTHPFLGLHWKIVRQFFVLFCCSGELGTCFASAGLEDLKRATLSGITHFFLPT